MRIALIVTLGGDLVRSTEHLGIGYIAAVLREKGEKVDIYEICKEDSLQSNLFKGLLDGTYDIIGFTTTCVTMKIINNFAYSIKKKNPKSYIVYGGHMATFASDELLERYGFIDFCIVGEGELTFAELVDQLEKKGDLATVKGLVYRKGKKIIINEERELIKNLDLLPFPVRDQFEMHGGKVQYIRISTSRGCLGSCAFCSNFVGRKQNGPRWRGRSPQNVVDEIEGLTRKYGFSTYDFVDSTFEDPGDAGKERIHKIAETIIERKLNIYYNCCFRAENWRNKDRDLLKLLVKSGLEKVNIGFEAGNNRGLEILNKRAKIEDNYQVINLLREFPEIYLTFGFIMLHPYSTFDDLIDNADFLLSSGSGQVIRHYFWLLEVYPGTLMEKKLREDNLLEKGYNINDGMYSYNYQNQDMKKYKEVFSRFLTLSSIWDFEIFDILIHTFIYRLLRQYKGYAIEKEVCQFRDIVIESRKNMAQFNYSFFVNIIENVDIINISEEMDNLDLYIKEQIKKIKSHQYKLGIFLQREGYKIALK